MKRDEQRRWDNLSSSLPTDHDIELTLYPISLQKYRINRDFQWSYRFWDVNLSGLIEYHASEVSQFIKKEEEIVYIIRDVGIGGKYFL